MNRRAGSRRRRAAATNGKWGDGTKSYGGAVWIGLLTFLYLWSRSQGATNAAKRRRFYLSAIQRLLRKSFRNFLQGRSTQVYRAQAKQITAIL